MSDPSLELLAQQLREHCGEKLWLADEHHHDILPILCAYKDTIQIISNRFDIAEQAEKLGLNTSFNDWVFDLEKPVDSIFFRVCKEKPVSKHLIHESFNQLQPGGKLVMVGQKNEGIKTYEKIASELFTENPRVKHLKKIGSNYLGTFTKEEKPPYCATDDYHQLSLIAEYQQKHFYSKAGVYGWNKIDKGSEVLIASLDSAIKEYGISTASILDLGCGYGFLSLASSHLNCQRRTATDNNAAAIICCGRNAKENNIDLEIVAGDCADTVEGKFDLVLCNPPFHKGFDVDGELTKLFLKASRGKLNAKGVAIFVVNSFIPIEKKLTQYYRRSIEISNTGQFKVLALFP